MSSLPDWMRPPRPEGWFADDLDQLADAPRHTELLDGALIFMMSPQRYWHSEVVTWLTVALKEQAPAQIRVAREMTIRLDERNRPEPDIVATTAGYDADRTFFNPADVVLVVEVMSPESAHRDRTVKLRKYAEAGIPYYWLVEEEPEGPAVHLYELDRPTSQYVASSIARGRLQTSLPFRIDLDLPSLS